MSVKTEDVKKIAHLARIAISDDEAVAYNDQLNSILGLIDELNTVDTTQIKPLAHPFEAKQRLRPDVVSEKNERETLMAGSISEAGLYLVPKVVEGGE